ncbi:MAG: GNAT family N-acetyltransferase, partial [Candidatus Omnitrophica bacterium]|nr:GNAT family N-acetyltransferase [Candidatus Omnitrophota bacterium]
VVDGSLQGRIFKVKIGRSCADDIEEKTSIKSSSSPLAASQPAVRFAAEVPHEARDVLREVVRLYAQEIGASGVSIEFIGNNPEEFALLEIDALRKASPDMFQTREQLIAWFFKRFGETEKRDPYQMDNAQLLAIQAKTVTLDLFRSRIAALPVQYYLASFKGTDSTMAVMLLVITPGKSEGGLPLVNMREIPEEMKRSEHATAALMHYHSYLEDRWYIIHTGMRLPIDTRAELFTQAYHHYAGKLNRVRGSPLIDIWTLCYVSCVIYPAVRSHYFDLKNLTEKIPELQDEREIDAIIHDFTSHVALKHGLTEELLYEHIRSAVDPQWKKHFLRAVIEDITVANPLFRSIFPRGVYSAYLRLMYQCLAITKPQIINELVSLTKKAFAVPEGEIIAAARAELVKEFKDRPQLAQKEYVHDKLDPHAKKLPLLEMFDVAVKETLVSYMQVASVYAPYMGDPAHEKQAQVASEYFYRTFIILRALKRIQQQEGKEKIDQGDLFSSSPLESPDNDEGKARWLREQLHEVNRELERVSTLGFRYKHQKGKQAELEGLRTQFKSLRKKIAFLAAQIPAEIAVNDRKALERLNQDLRQELLILDEEIAKDDLLERDDLLARFNAIKQEKLWLRTKAQLTLALQYLSMKGIYVSAALVLLVGARNNMQTLINKEYYWFRVRQFKEKKQATVELSDWLGAVVRSIESQEWKVDAAEDKEACVIMLHPWVNDYVLLTDGQVEVYKKQIEINIKLANFEKGVRALVHRFVSRTKEYMVLLDMAAHLRHIIINTTPYQAGISEEVKVEAKEIIERALKWVGRGISPYARKRAKADLDNALQYLTASEFDKAIEYLEYAIAKFKQRMSYVDKKRMSALFHADIFFKELRLRLTAKEDIREGVKLALQSLKENRPDWCLHILEEIRMEHFPKQEGRSNAIRQPMDEETASMHPSLITAVILARKANTEKGQTEALEELLGSMLNAFLNEQQQRTDTDPASSPLMYHEQIRVDLATHICPEKLFETIRSINISAGKERWNNAKLMRKIMRDWGRRSEVKIFIATTSPEKIVGYIVFLESDRPLYKRCLSRYVPYLAVEGGYQRKGIGQELAYAVRAYAKEKGLRDVRSYTGDKRTHMLHMFRSVAERLNIRLKRELVRPDDPTYVYPDDQSHIVKITFDLRKPYTTKIHLPASSPLFSVMRERINIFDSHRSILKAFKDPDFVNAIPELDYLSYETLNHSLACIRNIPVVLRRIGLESTPGVAWLLRRGGINRIVNATLFLHDLGRVARKYDPYGHLAQYSIERKQQILDRTLPFFQVNDPQAQDYFEYLRHPYISAEIAKKRLPALGFSDDEIEIIQFLIWYHSVLSEQANYGCIKDQTPYAQFSQELEIAAAALSQIPPYSTQKILFPEYQSFAQDAHVPLRPYRNDLLDLLLLIQLTDAFSVKRDISFAMTRRTEEKILKITHLMKGGDSKKEELDEFLVTIGQESMFMDGLFARELEALKLLNPNIDVMMLIKAYKIAYRAHEGQWRAQRKKKIVGYPFRPFVEHPVSTSHIGMSCFGKKDEVFHAKCFLHDTPEDTDTPLDAIREEFTQGDDIVRSATLLAKPHKSDYAREGMFRSERRETAYLARILCFGDHDDHVIKVSDKIHNLRTLHALPLDSRVLELREAREIFLPLLMQSVYLTEEEKITMLNEFKSAIGSVVRPEDSARNKRRLRGAVRGFRERIDYYKMRIQQGNFDYTVRDAVKRLKGFAEGDPEVTQLFVKTVRYLDATKVLPVRFQRAIVKAILPRVAAIPVQDRFKTKHLWRGNIRIRYARKGVFIDGRRQVAWYAFKYFLGAMRKRLIAYVKTKRAAQAGTLDEVISNDLHRYFEQNSSSPLSVNEHILPDPLCIVGESSVETGRRIETLYHRVIQSNFPRGFKSRPYPYVCRPSSHILAKVVHAITALPVGGVAPERIEIVLGWHIGEWSHHQWNKIIVGSRELFIDGLIGQFNRKYTGRIVTGPYKDTLQQFHLGEYNEGLAEEMATMARVDHGTRIASAVEKMFRDAASEGEQVRRTGRQHTLEPQEEAMISLSYEQIMEQLDGVVSSPLIEEIDKTAGIIKQKLGVGEDTEKAYFSGSGHMFEIDKKSRSYKNVVLDVTYFVRVSDLIFLQAEQKDLIIPIIDNGYCNRILFFQSLGSVFCGMSDVYYTAATIMALRTIGEAVGNEVVLDLGTREGVLGIAAIKSLGAKKIIGIERQEGYKRTIAFNSHANGIPHERYQFVCENFAHPKDIMQAIGADRDEIRIVLANIGPHYGESDLYAIRLLEHFPRAHTFVGGGYVQKEPDGNDFDLGSEKAETALGQLGFVTKSVVLLKGSDPRQQKHFSFKAFVAARTTADHSSSPLSFKELLDSFLAEKDDKATLKTFGQICRIITKNGESGARAILMDNIKDFFEAFVARMKSQDTMAANSNYASFYRIARKMLDEEYLIHSLQDGITVRTPRFWSTLITVSRLKKLREFFGSDELLLQNKEEAVKVISATTRNPDVAAIKQIIWSLIHEEVNLLNFGIEEEVVPFSEEEAWLSEADGRLNQPMALSWRGHNYNRSRFWDRLYSLRQTIEYAGSLPIINPRLDASDIKGHVNIVSFYERWSDDFIVQLRHLLREKKSNMVLASGIVKNIVLNEKDGVVSAHLLFGLLYDKESRLTLARFSAPLEIHYIYMALKSPYAAHISRLGIPVLVDYPLGELATQKPAIAQLLSGFQAETGIKIPAYISFKKGSLLDMSEDAFGEELQLIFSLAQNEEIVVKPASGSGGRGIRFFRKQDIQDIFAYGKELNQVTDIIIEERIRMSPAVIGGDSFDSTMRFHSIRDAQGNPVVYRGFCQIGKGVVNLTRREGEAQSTREIAMKDLLRHMSGLHLSEDDIERLILSAEQGVLKVQRIVEHIGIEGDVLSVHLDRAPTQELDHVVVDLYFDGENFILNEINVGNIGGFINYDRVYPDRKGMLAEALSRRLVKRAADYERNVKRLRRWDRAGAPTVGTEVEIVLTKIGKDGHRRQMTPAEAEVVLERCPAAKNEPSIALDSSGGIETNSGSGTMYDIEDETARFARNCCTLLKCLNEVIASLQGTEDDGSILISCTGQYSSGIHLNMRKPLYGQDVEPNETADKDYRKIKRALPIISGLSTNPSEGLWHPLTRQLKVRQVFEFFNIRRYGEIVYNTRHSEAGMPPRLEIRPPDTPLHPAYVGLYYALIYSALTGKSPQELTFEEYHKAFCNGAMDNLRGSVLFDGERVSLAEALNKFYDYNKDIFEELQLDAAHQELLDAARLNGFTYKDFNDAVGRIVDEITFLRLTLEIFTKACYVPERKLSDIIRDSLADAGKTFGASDSQREAILELSDMFAYRPRNLASQDKEELPPAIETIEQGRGISLRVITETGSFCAVTLTRINGKGIIEFVGEETAERGMLDVL